MGIGKDPTPEELKQRAADIGLTKLTDTHLAELKNAVAAMHSMIDSMPRDLALADEPAHTFRASDEA
jgi:hypothetical protein